MMYYEAVYVGAATWKRYTTKRWTREQDAVILSSVREMGHNWGFIAGIMPGRSELSIRNRWQRLHSKQVEQGMAPVMVGS